MEHRSLMTKMYVCVDMGGILGMNSLIGMEDAGISLIKSYKIILKEF